MSMVETQIGVFRKRLWSMPPGRLLRYLGMENRSQSGSKKAGPVLPQPLLQEFDRRVTFVAGSVEKRQNTELPDSRRDLLLATYVLGLTSPFFEDGSPDQHLETIRNCLARAMSSERVTQALLAAPAEGDDWYTSALDPIEAIGRKDGRALYMRYIGAGGTTPIQN